MSGWQGSSGTLRGPGGYWLSSTQVGRAVMPPTLLLDRRRTFAPAALRLQSARRLRASPAFVVAPRLNASCVLPEALDLHGDWIHLRGGVAGALVDAPYSVRVWRLGDAPNHA